MYSAIEKVPYTLLITPQKSDITPMRNWKVIHVKPRCEKKLAKYCRIYKIPFYLPLREKTRVVQRRKIKVTLPLFSGYLFVSLDHAQRLPLLQTNLLVRVLEPRSSVALLRNLVMIRRALRANPALETTKPLTRGQLVRIINGPFCGIEGRVARLSGTLKVILNVEMIGQAVAVTASIAQIDVIN